MLQPALLLKKLHKPKVLCKAIYLESAKQLSFSMILFYYMKNLADKAASDDFPYPTCAVLG